MSYSGGCFCKAVRYRATRIFDAGYCHCSVCRRISGAAAVCWFNVREEDFALLQGRPRALRSSAHFTRWFCADCGTHLYGTDAGPAPASVGSRLVSAMLGTLDDPAAVAPRLHQWWGSRLPWFEQCLALPRHETGQVPHPDRRGTPPPN